MIKNLLSVSIATILMAVFTFAIGYIPIYMHLDPAHLSIASLASMGLLVSTALVVVIPEGIETVIGASSDDSQIHAIGLLLLAGFVLMYLLDNFDSIPYLNDFLERLNLSQQQDSQQQKKLTPLVISRSVFSSSITFGLVIHAVTDGISLGTSFTRMSSFQIMFYISLLAHKLPTSISLVTILIKENYSYSIIPFHLGIFALSSPITSFITYLALSMGTTDPLVVGYLLLFSGGTFLYVVIHVILDINSSHSSSHSTPLPQSSAAANEFEIANEYDEEATEQEVIIKSSSSSLTGYQLIASLIGMCVPIVLSFLLGH